MSLTGLDALLFAPRASANALRVGEPAPIATLVTLDGRRIFTSDLLGHVVRPMRQGIAARGHAVLAFTLDSPDELRIWRIPANFTIDRDGVLIDSGWKDKDSTWTADRLERIVDPLLSRSSGAT